jgi:LPXTG-motif cell wall-anchored protein
MKKLALALLASAAAVFGFGMVANAQSYVPVVTPPTGPTTIGGAFSVTYNNCFVGETITFTLFGVNGTTVLATVQGPCLSPISVGSVVGLLLPQQTANGSASGNFTSSPTEPGTYPIRAQGATSPAVTTQLVVQGTTTTVAPPVTTPGGGLPATGSDSSTPFTMIAIGLFTVGVGLFAVAQVRRRQAPSPA